MLWAPRAARSVSGVSVLHSHPVLSVRVSCPGNMLLLGGLARKKHFLLCVTRVRFGAPSPSEELQSLSSPAKP